MSTTTPKGVLFINIKDIYLCVVRQTSLSQAVFLDALNRVLGDLTARFPRKQVFGNNTQLPIESIQDGIDLHEVYQNAVINGILAYVTNDETRWDRYRRSADEAYRAVWRDTASGKPLRKRGYGHV